MGIWTDLDSEGYLAAKRTGTHDNERPKFLVQSKSDSRQFIIINRDTVVRMAALVGLKVIAPTDLSALQAALKTAEAANGQVKAAITRASLQVA